MEELCLTQAIKIIEDNFYKEGVIKKYKNCVSEEDVKSLALEILEKIEGGSNGRKNDRKPISLQG